MFLGSPACVVQVQEAHLKPAASSSASSAGQRRHSAGDSSYTTRGVKILCSSSGTQKSVAKNDAAGPRGLASFDTPHHPTGRLPMSLPFMCRSTRSVTSVNSPSRREQPQQSRHPAHHGVMHSGLVVPLPLRPCAYTYAHLLSRTVAAAPLRLYICTPVGRSPPPAGAGHVGQPSVHAQLPLGAEQRLRLE